jgi:hypothetical protein
MEGAMRKRQSTLRDRDVQAHAAALLQRHLRLRNFSRKTTVQVVLHILFVAAATLSSIYAACQRLRDGVSDDTLRQALLAMLPDFPELQRRVNRVLAATIPKALKRRRPSRLRLAIDLTLIPYHGQPEADPKEIYRGKAKDGTSHFHAYASAYRVQHGQRCTVALLPVEQGTKMETVVQRLLRLVSKTSLRPKLLLLDRGFYSVGVMRYLQAARVPFLMPAVARGRKRTDRSATGIRAFQLWKRGGWGQHTLREGSGRPATVQICVSCGNYRGQWKRHGRYAWVYAYWGLARPSSPRWVADTYRQRFGIETSFRQLNEARIKTCVRSPLLRFLFVALALLLRNVWVWFHWEVLSSPRRGRRRLNLERLRFKRLLFWLLQVALAELGTRAETKTERRYAT